MTFEINTLITKDLKSLEKWTQTPTFAHRQFCSVTWVTIISSLINSYHLLCALDFQISSTRL